jgi:hypothetical protein
VTEALFPFLQELRSLLNAPKATETYDDFSVSDNGKTLAYQLDFCWGWGWRVEVPATYPLSMRDV